MLLPRAALPFAAFASLAALGFACGSAPSTSGGTGGTGAGKETSSSTTSTTTQSGGTAGHGGAGVTGTGGATGTGGVTGTGGAGSAIKTVFIILMENKQWSDIKGNTDAPYINNTLMPMGSYCQNYHNPPNNHPSETNYIWLEAGSNLGITTDDPPATNHQSTTAHLVSLLEKAGLTWKSYQDGIDGTSCQLTDDSNADYAVRHDPMVFFDDVTDGMDPASQHCIEHVRPYSELAGDLASNNVAQYNFITPSLCHDMHGFSSNCLIPHVSDGDTWLSNEVPTILGSQAYQQGGALFVTWDECEQTEIIKCEGPIGMIVLSPFAKGGGYSNGIMYDHSSTLRTFEEIFKVQPFLGGAAAATDLSDLFSTFP